MFVNVSAIVLSARPASETDKRLTLFTRERGRLFARAVGARRSGARLAAATEPTVESRFRLWLPPESASARITGGALTTSFQGLRRDWARLTSALFLCEWTDRLTGLDQPSPEKYDLLRSALEALERGAEGAVRLTFLLRFIEKAGYGAANPTAAPDALSLFHAWDFVAPAPTASTDDMSRWEESLVRSMGPLMARPLQTRSHQNALLGFRSRTTPRPTAE